MTDLISLDRLVLASQPFSRFIGAELEPYAADNALTFADGSVLGPGVVTSEFKIYYVRPALGTVPVARASVVYAGKSQAVCRCDVFAVKDGAEVLCAVAQGTISRLGGGPAA